MILTCSQGWQPVNSLVWVLSRGCSALESIFFQSSFPLSFSYPRPIHPNPLWELPLQEHKVEYLQSRLSAGDNPLPCRGHLAMSGGIFGCHPWGSNGGNPGMLLNIFNEEDRTPLTPPNTHTTNIQAKMSVVPRSRTLDLQEGTVG